MDVRILLVEDDEIICSTVKAFLLEAGFQVDACGNGTEAFEQFYEHNYQLVLLDILLPGMNGYELLREIRKISDVPILMMTALSDSENELKAFDGEADDYVTKPFKIQVLIKRVEALLRRTGALAKTLTIGKLILYPDNYSVQYNEKQINLTLKEFEILMLLIQNKGKTMTHEMILSRIWGYDFIGDESTVHTHIKNLRRKLPVKIIKTVRGIGYYLEESE